MFDVLGLVLMCLLVVFFVAIVGGLVLCSALFRILVVVCYFDFAGLMCFCCFYL